MSDIPLEDHAFLSDCHSAALVTRAGSVDWLCFPRFDAPSVFARLLDDDAGHLLTRPVGDAEVTRRYLDDSLVLETTFTTSTGTVVLTDALALRADDSGHPLGSGAPHALLRRLRCTEGRVEVEVVFAPRPEYGLTRPLLVPVEGGVLTRGAPAALALWIELPLDTGRSQAEGRATLVAGQELTIAQQWARAWEGEPARWRPEEVVARLADTTAAWQRWAAEHQRYEGPWRELVRCSGRVLQGLTFQPTGAVVAAATTSQAGGTAGRYGSATAPTTRSSSTSTARCSLPSPGCATSSARSTTRPGGSCASSHRRPSTAGSSATRASGRSAAARSTC